MRVINGIPLGSSLLLPVDIVNYAETLKAFIRNYRQGMSVVSAANLLVESCVFGETNGTMPMVGGPFFVVLAGSFCVLEWGARIRTAVAADNCTSPANRTSRVAPNPIRFTNMVSILFAFSMMSLANKGRC
jgi:hypothetical protein